MKKLAAILTLLLAGVFVPAAADSAQAAGWACSQYVTQIGVANGNGDAAAAMKASSALSACQYNGIGAAVSTTLSGCGIYRTLATSALVSGNAGSAAIWNAAYNDCLINTQTYLNTRNSSSSSSGNSTNGNSGTSTGNSGNGNSGCTAAPASPVLTSRYTLKGITVKFSAAEGQITNRIPYNVAYYNSATKSWGAWVGWNYATPNTEVSFVAPSSDELKMSLVAAAQNVCGNSANIHLDQDNRGVLIFDPPMDAISQRVSSVTVTSSVNVSQLFSSQSGIGLTVTSGTPETCSIAGGLVTFRAAGSCVFIVSSVGTSELMPQTLNLQINVTPKVKTITCYKKGNTKLTKKVTAIAPKCPTGYSTAKG
jgi:hypothetical protein